MGQIRRKLEFFAFIIDPNDNALILVDTDYDPVNLHTRVHVSNQVKVSYSSEKMLSNELLDFFIRDFDVFTVWLFSGHHSHPCLGLSF